MIWPLELAVTTLELAILTVVVAVVWWVLRGRRRETSGPVPSDAMIAGLAVWCLLVFSALKQQGFESVWRVIVTAAVCAVIVGPITAVMWLMVVLVHQLRRHRPTS